MAVASRAAIAVSNGVGAIAITALPPELAAHCAGGRQMPSLVQQQRHRDFSLGTAHRDNGAPDPRVERSPESQQERNGWRRPA